MPVPPSRTPVGLQLSRTAHAVTQACERSMAEAGGSVSTWQVLVLIRSQRWGTQAEMAEAMGLTGATLTHHLGALEARGLVRRWRETSDRRVQQMELTEAGVTMFDRLAEVAKRHDELLRSGLTDAEAELFRGLLEKVGTAVSEAV